MVKLFAFSNISKIIILPTLLTELKKLVSTLFVLQESLSTGLLKVCNELLYITIYIFFCGVVGSALAFVLKSDWRGFDSRCILHFNLINSLEHATMS